MTSGLGLEGGYRDTLAHQLVHQRGLAHIGIAHDIYESCFMFHVFFIYAANFGIFLETAKLLRHKKKNPDDLSHPDSFL
jgi:hypothetical protein